MIGLGLGLGLPMSAARAQIFDLASLFASGEIGWVEPMLPGVTLFQDAAGTIPVTAPGQPVGLSKFTAGGRPGFVQATALNRPIYGIHPITGQRNLLTFTEQFDNAVWTKLNATITANSTVAPDGTTTADTITDNATSGAHYAQVLNVFTADGLTRFWSIYVKQGTARYISLSSYDIDIATSVSSRVTFDMQEGVYTVQGAEADTVLTPVNAGNGWWRIGFSSNTNSARYDGFRVEMNSDGTSAGSSYSGTGSTVFIWGAQLELGSTATAYQKVVSRYEVTEAGVQSIGYLSHNGTNQWMSTAAFAWGSDKATIVAGVRKLSDGAIQALYELSENINNNNGCFIASPGYSGVGNVTGPYWNVGSKGSLPTGAVSPASYPAPQTAVQTLLSDIGGDTLTQRINGDQVGQSTADQGSGNFGTYPLYAGARAGTSLFFNGNRYPSIGINRLLTEAELAQVEAWVNQRTGAF